ncbi:MAG: metallophosphoesterase family protein, partial [Blastocatellia bacterium]
MKAKWQMAAFCLTSAKEDTGIEELRNRIGKLIDWQDLSRTSRPRLFQRVRQPIDEMRGKGDVVLLSSDLETRLKAAEPEEFRPGAVNSVVEQLARQGAITDSRLSTGDRTLILQIGFVDVYSGSLILIARESSRSRGVPAVELSDAIFRKSFPGIKDSDRLPPLQERQVMECVVELMIDHGICLKHERLLIFPDLFPVAPADDEETARRAVSLFYDFSGAISNIYSSLVVRLAISDRFGRARFWKDRAEFDRPGQGVCGLRRMDRPGGWSHLDLLFSEETAEEARSLFTVFVEEHLQKEGVTIREVLEMKCACGYPFDESLVGEYIDAGRREIDCPRPNCGTPNRIGKSASKIREASAAVTEELVALRKTIKIKQRRDIEEAQREMRPSRRIEESVQRLEPGSVFAPNPEKAPIRILHLSDLHFRDGIDPMVFFQPLKRDLEDKEEGFGVSAVDYLVVSGDISNRASEEEFENAHKFMSGLMSRFALAPTRCVIVPGNHDLSWAVEAYKWRSKTNVDLGKLSKGSYVEQEKVYGMRDEQSYPKRFENFQRFYHQLTQVPYPSKPEEQCMAFLFEEDGIQFLALNSAWEIDEYFKDRSSINQSALAAGLLKAGAQIDNARKEGRLEKDRSVLRIAVWHHPVTGNEKIASDAFMEQLRQENFKLCLHGHVHEDRADMVGYLHPRKVYVAGAGSFGAPVNQRPESTPRLYNLIEVWRDHSKIR